MLPFLGNFWSASLAAFRRSWEDPNLRYMPDQALGRIYDYNVLWSYYNNNAWDDVRSWALRKQRFQLYRAMRGIYNPVRRLVDFYAGAVYPGVLSTDASEFTDGVPTAIPLDDKIPPQLSAAISQLWQWSNWQAGKSVYVRYGAAVGSSFVEVVDDLESERVYLDVIWPGFITELDTDKSGNVQSYTIMYETIGPSGQMYMYRRDVDRNEYREYNDGKLVRQWDNPYGFVPAVIAPHKSLGGMWGAPAISGSLQKVDELNSIASHVHDQIHKKISAPGILWSRAAVKKLTDQAKRPADESEFSEQRFSNEREEVLFLSGPEGGRLDSLAGTLELKDALPYIERSLQEISDDHPELAAYKELRALSQLTGPAASRIVGDAAANLYESSANYDQQSIKLFQMAVAIAGYRSTTYWTQNNRQQAKFQPFDLASYFRGDLDFSILPRPLMPSTSTERANDLVVQMQAVDNAVKAGIPLEIFLKQQLRWPDDVIQRITAINDKVRADNAQITGLTPKPPPVQVGPAGNGVV